MKKPLQHRNVSHYKPYTIKIHVFCTLELTGGRESSDGYEIKRKITEERETTGGYETEQTCEKRTVRHVLALKLRN